MTKCKPGKSKKYPLAKKAVLSVKDFFSNLKGLNQKVSANAAFFISNTF